MWAARTCYQRSFPAYGESSTMKCGNPIAEAVVGRRGQHGAPRSGRLRGRYGAYCADQNGIRLKCKATVKLKAPLVDPIMGPLVGSAHLRNRALYDEVGQGTCLSRWQHQCSPLVPVQGALQFRGAQGWQPAPVERCRANGLEPFCRSDRRRCAPLRAISKFTRRTGHTLAGPRITRSTAGLPPPVANESG